MMRRSFVFLFVLLAFSAAKAPVRTLPESAADAAFIRADFDSALSGYLDLARSAATPQESLLRISQAWDLRSYSTRSSELTNALTRLAASVPDGPVRFACRNLLSRYWLEAGRPERCREALAGVTILTDWTLSGSYNRLGGQADLDHRFAPETLGSIPAFTNELVSHPPLPLSAATPVGELRPWDQVVPSSGTVYLSRTIDMPRAGTYLLLVVTRESFKVFLNGTEQFRNWTPDGSDGLYHPVRLVCPEGRSVLMIKATDATRDPFLRVMLMDTSFGPVAAASSADIPERIFEPAGDHPLLTAVAARMEGRENEFHKAFIRMERSGLTGPLLACYYGRAVIEDSGEHASSSRTARGLRFLDHPSIASSSLGQSLLASYYGQQEMTEEALSHAADAVRLNTNSVYALLVQTELFRSGNWRNECSASIARVLSLNPRSLPAAAFLAEWTKENAPEQAGEAFRRLAELDPGGPGAIEAVRWFIVSDRPDEAERILTAYSVLDRGSAEARLLAADIAMRRCKPDRASELLSSIDRRTAGRSDILIRLASMPGADVKKYLLRASEIDPSDSRIADRLSLISFNRIRTMEDRLDPALRKTALDRFFSTSPQEGPPAEILLNEETLEINRDGTWGSVSRQIVRVIDRKGIQLWGNPSIEAVVGQRILAARTILKSGETIDAPVPRRQEGRLVFAYPSVQEDCLIELVSFTPGTWNGVPGTLYHSSSPRFLGMIDQPVRTLRHTVIMPSDLEYTVRTERFDGRCSLLTSADGPRRLRTVISATDLPAVKNETLLPPLERLIPSWRAVRFPGTFQDFGNWYVSLTSTVLGPAPELNDLLMTLSENRELSRRGLNLIRHLYEWIGRELRPAGGGLYDPDPLRKVCDQRLATTEERVLLMKYFLDRMEVPNTILLVRMNERSEPDPATWAPSLDSFDEPVLQFLWDGQTNILDMSSRWMPFGTIGWEKDGAWALDTSTGGLVRLRKTDGAEPDLVISSNSVTVMTDRIILSGRRTFNGYFGLYAELFSELNSRDLQANQLEAREIPGFTMTNIRFSERTAVPGYDVSGYAEGFAVRYEKEWQVPLAGHHAKLADLFVGSPERHNDLWISSPVRFRQRTEYDLSGLGSQTEVILPDDTILSNRHGRFLLTWRKTAENRVVAESGADIPSGFVKPGDYADFVKFCSEADRREKVPLIIRKK